MHIVKISSLLSLLLHCNKPQRGKLGIIPIFVKKIKIEPLSAAIYSFEVYELCSQLISILGHIYTDMLIRQIRDKLIVGKNLILLFKKYIYIYFFY